MLSLNRVWGDTIYEDWETKCRYITYIRVSWSHSYVLHQLRCEVRVV